MTEDRQTVRPKRQALELQLQVSLVLLLFIKTGLFLHVVGTGQNDIPTDMESAYLVQLLTKDFDSQLTNMTTHVFQVVSSEGPAYMSRTALLSFEERSTC